MRRAVPFGVLRERNYALIPSASSKRAGYLTIIWQPFGQSARHLANVREETTSNETWFTSYVPRYFPHTPKSFADDEHPPDERTLKLGKTVQIIHNRLPTLLASPLPQEILSPQISLHLFPSTHPHLPTVSGRLAYSAALWTAPVAWGRVPVVGNIRLIILSERMVKNGSSDSNFRNEKLIVRWKTCGKTKSRGMGALYRGIDREGDQVDKITEVLGGDGRDDEEFSGLFIFEFDEEGRIARHTIEHAQEGGNWEKHTRVVSVTDWLIGKAKGKKNSEEPGYALGYCEAESQHPRRSIHDIHDSETRGR